MDEKVLCVDDDPNILAGFRRGLHKVFSIDVALGGAEGLEAVKRGGPYAVIVSDMKMPGMDGVQFLSKAKEISPDSVRMMLTGYADINSAIEAVNEGNIFRFLTKPCPMEVFAKALNAGISQYRLIMAERELLEKTLSRSIKVLVDILSMVNPVAFSRAARIRRYVKHMITELNLQDSWQFELAAILSQIGCVTIPPDTIEKFYADQPLTDAEREMFASHPVVGMELLVKIPRLEAVAAMIEQQMKPFDAYEGMAPPARRAEMDLGAQMLKVATEFDKLVSGGAPYRKAVDELLKRTAECDPQIVVTLRNISAGKADRISGLIKIRDLAVGMVIAENIYAKNKMLLVPKGQDVTFTLLERIKNFWRNGLVEEQIRVLFERHDFREDETNNNG